jgi:hypothetical protein
MVTPDAEMVTECPAQPQNFMHWAREATRMNVEGKKRKAQGGMKMEQSK